MLELLTVSSSLLCIMTLDDWIVATYTNFGTLFKGMAKTDSLDPSVYNALLAEMVTSANGYRLVPEESYFEADGGRPA